MKTFIQFLMEMPYRKIDKLHPTQHYKDSHIDKGWVDYLRRHLKSKKSEAEFIRRNPTFTLTTVTGFKKKTKVDPKTKLWKPIRVEPSNWQWRREKGDNELEHDVWDGNHRYWAKKLEGRKKIKTNI